MIRKKSSNLLPLTILHPLVDACSAALFVYASNDVWQAFLYNFIAFALQFPMGWVLDARRAHLRRLLLVAAAFLLGGICVFAFFRDPVIAIVLACLGNGLFHVVAGKHLMDDSDGKSSHVSIFISTGALGLIAGMRLGAEWPLLMIGGAFVCYLLVMGLSWRMMDVRLNGGRMFQLQDPVRPLELSIVALLAGIVVWRSFGVLTATSAFSKFYRATPLLAVLALSSWLGQFVSGWFADRCGRIKVLAVSLVGSAILFYCCPENHPLVWLALMFCAQLATGPVLGMLYHYCGARSGLAFGVNCLALFISTLFINCPTSALHYLAGDFLAIALEFAATAWVGLPYWFGAIVLVNMCTHPALVYAIRRIGYSLPLVVCGEIVVVAVEFGLLMLLYAFYGQRKIAPWKMSGVAVWMNAVSYFVGVCLFGW